MAVWTKYEGSQCNHCKGEGRLGRVLMNSSRQCVGTPCTAVHVGDVLHQPFTFQLSKEKRSHGGDTHIRENPH